MSRATMVPALAVLWGLFLPTASVAQVPSGVTVVMPFENVREDVQLT